MFLCVMRRYRPCDGVEPSSEAFLNRYGAFET